MCGIAGFIDTKNSINVSQGEMILNRMMTRIKYRGPDDCGLYIESQMGMGNVRLSIIDVSGGNQPLSNERGNLWIVYNGEVFNYIELRDQLILKGHRFKTESDTEVVLHMYEEYGHHALQYLNGQFAFSIWDKNKKELFIARDRTGIRPFFYTMTNNLFVFGSEIKSIFEYPGVPKQLSYNALKETFTFWAPITPNTIFDHVYELPPGYYAKYKNGHLEINRYWSLRFATTQNLFSGSISDALDQFRYLINDSVQLRLRSDVPVAAYLSGGLDSSVTTALIKKVAPGLLNTFSIGFADNNFDETNFQEEVAKFLGTNHTSIMCSSEDIAEWFPKVIWHSEIPILRTSPAPMMGLSRLVHQNGIKVVITGEGADEAFAGYNIFKETLIRQFWAKQPQSKYRPMLFSKLYSYVPYLKNASPFALKQFFGYQLNNTNSPIYSHLIRWHNTMSIQRHFSSELKNQLQDYDPVEQISARLQPETEGISSLAKAQLIESNIFMSGYLLSSQGDRVSMANSVEGRYPFLDHRLLEFAASLPDEFKLKGMNEKYLIKALIKDEIPISVITRPKQAFRSPISTSFINNNKSTYVKDYLSEKSINENHLFNYNSVKNLINKLETTDRPSEIDKMALAGILSTQMVFDYFIKNFEPLSESDIIHGIIRNN